MAKESTPTDLIGKLVGRYRIEKRLGSGGMGDVYLGRQVEIGSRVAIKIMSRGKTDSEGAKRMFAEARAVNLVQHDRIVNVLDMTRVDGQPALIMEYLRGVSLDRLLGGGPLPARSIAELAIDILDALAAVHAQEIFHRDLKPGNVYVSPEGRATLLDFGLAKMADDLLGTVIQTQAGMVMGTVPYMAPEQARGEPFSAASDVFAVGVLLYEAACSKRPFQGISIFELLKEHERGPTPLGRMGAKIPTSLEVVIGKALAIDVNQRYPSAREMHADLTGLLPTLEPASLRKRIEKFQRRSSAFVGVQPAFSDAKTVRAKPIAPPPESSFANYSPAVDRKSRWLTLALCAMTAAFVLTAVLAIYWRNGGESKTEKRPAKAKPMPAAAKPVIPSLVDWDMDAVTMPKPRTEPGNDPGKEPGKETQLDPEPETDMSGQEKTGVESAEKEAKRKSSAQAESESRAKGKASTSKPRSKSKSKKPKSKDDSWGDLANPFDPLE